MDWKAFTVRMIEVLRWPAAFVVVFFLLRGPIGQFVSALAGKLAG